MSIKIDLLPSYVGLRRWFRRLLVASAALLSSVGMILFVLYYKDKQQLDKLTTDLANVQANKTQAIAADAATKSATDAAAPVQDTVSFYVDAGRTGVDRAALIDLVSRYIYENSQVTSVDISDGKTVKIAANVSSPEDFGNFLLKMRNGSETNGGVLFAADPKSNSVLPTSGLNGFDAANRPRVPQLIVPTDRPEVIELPLPITVTATLQNPIVIPTAPGEAGGGAAAGTPGAPGAATPPATPG